MLRRILRLIDADGCVLTGGEITLRKDCAQLINKAISLYKSVQIQTNGRRITQQLIDSICDLKKCNFAVAVHGSQPIHDAITRVKNSYTQTVEGLKVLSRAHAETCLKFVLSRVNYKDIDHVVQLDDQLDFRRINIAYVHGCGDARVNIDQLLVPYEEIQPYVIQIWKRSHCVKLILDFIIAVTMCTWKKLCAPPFMKTRMIGNMLERFKIKLNRSSVQNVFLETSVRGIGLNTT